MFDNIVFSSTPKTAEDLRNILKSIGAVREFSNSRQLLDHLQSKVVSGSVILDAGSDLRSIRKMLSHDLIAEERFQFLVLLTKSDLLQAEDLLLNRSVDFAIKPLRVEELLFRLKKMHANLFYPGSGQLEHLIDILSLTLKEAIILKHFYGAKNRELSRDRLRELVWRDTSVTSKVIDVHLFNLRKKLKSKNIFIGYCRSKKSWSLETDKISVSF